MVTKKKRTKALPLGIVATETAPGNWTWETTRFQWQWDDFGGLNLSVRNKADNQPLQRVMYFGKLANAALWTAGFDAGFTSPAR